jgi:hypothetical protein
MVVSVMPVGSSSASVRAAHRGFEDARVFAVQVAVRVFEADARAPVAFAVLGQHAQNRMRPRRCDRRAAASTTW